MTMSMTSKTLLLLLDYLLSGGGIIGTENVPLPIYVVGLVNCERVVALAAGAQDVAALSLLLSGPTRVALQMGLHAYEGGVLMVLHHYRSII